MDRSRIGISKIAVNISVKFLEEKNFVDEIKVLLSRTQCHARWIEIEVTESDVMQNERDSIEKLNQLVKLGFKIAVDDFGTGYSSLAYLKRLPIHKLKIDRSFIMEIPNDNDDIEIVKTILLLAKGLNLDVIAEGVETKEQEEFLALQECRCVQGFLFSKPLAKEDFERYLKEKS